MARWIPSPNFLPGSTDVGSNTTDTHQFTGSVSVTGSLTLNGAAVSTGGGGGGGISWDGSTANGVATFKDADEATVESNLTFDGSTLTVTGDVSASSNISASSFYGSADNLSASYTAHDTNNPILSKLDATGKINAEKYLTYEYASGHSYLYLSSNSTTRTPKLFLDHGLPGVQPNRRTTIWSHGTLAGYPFYITRRTTNIYYPITIWNDTSDQSQDKVGINLLYPDTASYRFDVSGSARFQEGLRLTGTLSMSGSTLEVLNGDIKVSSSAQYTVGSDTFYNLLSFYDAGKEKFVSGAVWNIDSERVELRNFGDDTGYKAFAADSIYTNGDLNFLVDGNAGNMIISNDAINTDDALTVVGVNPIFSAAENSTLYLQAGYKAGESTGIIKFRDNDENSWSEHSHTGSHFLKGLTASLGLTSTGNTILGNASSDSHQVSGTLHVSGGIIQHQYFSASISTPVNATCSLYNVFNYHLTANSVVTASSPVAGTSYLFFFRQDGTGSRTVSFSGFKWPGGTAPTLSTAGGAVDIVSGISDGTYIYADTTKAFS